MNISAENSTKSVPQVSGFRYIWNTMGRHHRGLLKEAMGNPAKASLHRWLDEPGSMKVSVALAAFNYLKTLYPEITMKSLTELK